MSPEEFPFTTVVTVAVAAMTAAVLMATVMVRKELDISPLPRPVLTRLTQALCYELFLLIALARFFAANSALVHSRFVRFSLARCNILLDAKFRPRLEFSEPFLEGPLLNKGVTAICEEVYLSW